MSDQQQREVYILEEFEGSDNGWVEANSPFQFDDYVEVCHEAYHRSKHHSGVYRIVDLDKDGDGHVCLIYYGGRKYIPALTHDGSNNQL